MYLIKNFLYFVFRRKRKGKGAKGRARSGGRTHQKGSKQQGKALQPTPTTYSSSTKLPIKEEDQSQRTEQLDECDGVSTKTNEGEENTKKSSAGLKKCFACKLNLKSPDILLEYMFLLLYVLTETEAQSLPVCNGQSSLFNHSNEEVGTGETCPDKLNSVTSIEPPRLRDLDTELLQSGKLKLTGKFLSGLV